MILISNISRKRIFKHSHIELYVISSWRAVSAITAEIMGNVRSKNIDYDTIIIMNMYLLVYVFAGMLIDFASLKAVMWLTTEIKHAL